MAISRRFFLKAGLSSVATVALSSTLITALLGKPDAAQALVHNILTKRFPYLDLETKGVKQFEAMLVSRSKSEVGDSGTSTKVAIDDNMPHVSFDRYVVREFAVNTNFLDHKNPHFPGIIFRPVDHLVSQDHSTERFI